MIPISSEPLGGGLAAADTFVPLAADWIEQPVASVFLRVAGQNAQRLAIADGVRRWTYADLAAQVAGMSAQLSGACRADSVIALAMGNDARAPAAMLASLVLGIPYVPIDLSFPADRNAQILTHARVSAIVTTADRRAPAAAAAGEVPVLVLEEAATESRCLVRATPDHVAYVIYTSGSTGRPKGVFQNQRNLLQHIRQYVNSIHLTNTDKTTLLYSPSVAGAILDIFGGLLTGAAVHVIDLRATGLAGIAEVLRREGVTIYHSMPPVLRAFLGGLSPEVRFGSVRVIYLAGDRLFRRDVDLCRRHFSVDARLHVGLISTESAGFFRHWTVENSTTLEDDLVPVGYGVDGRRSLLVGEHGRQVERGQVGEIVIDSRYMALGYWNNPELTAATFLPCPDDPLARRLHTGDLGRESAEGLLHFIGRKDRQVKIRGYRVEPAEVEAALRGCPGVTDAAVIARVVERNPELVAFVVIAGDDATDPARWLAQRLPAHMRPSTIIPLDAIPSLPNRKTDWRALVAIDDARRASLPPMLPSDSDRLDPDGVRPVVYLAVWTAWTALVGAAAFSANLSWEEAGGDSLKAMELILAIEQRLRRRIAADVFTNSLRPNDFIELLIQRFDVPVRLGDKQFRDALAAFAGGASFSFPEDGFDGFGIVAGNPAGSRPPLFWCMQLRSEHDLLTAAIGPDQPVHGMSSGYQLPKAYPLLRLLGRHYAEAITAMADDPYTIGGNCHGAHVAFEVAHALLDRGKTVHLLILMEAAIRRPFPGQVALLFGRDSPLHNPFLKGEDPRPDWDRLFASYTIDLIAGRHGHFFADPENLSDLVAKLRTHLARVESAR